ADRGAEVLPINITPVVRLRIRAFGLDQKTLQVRLRERVLLVQTRVARARHIAEQVHPLRIDLIGGKRGFARLPTSPTGLEHPLQLVQFHPLPPSPGPVTRRANEPSFKDNSFPA